MYSDTILLPFQVVILMSINGCYLATTALSLLCNVHGKQ